MVKKLCVPDPDLVSDFTKEDPWRVFRIMSEFVEGFEVLQWGCRH